MRWATVLMLMLLGAGGARAFEPSTTAVVLLHGKWGKPEQMAPVRDALRRAGFATETPVMPWAASRLYDVDFPAALAEIDAAVARLRAAGARRVAVAGQSMGAVAALARAAGAQPPDAVVLIAPGHLPGLGHLRDSAAADVARARDMVAAGNGDASMTVSDLNTGNRTRSVTMTARAYLSYFDPDGPMAPMANAPRIGGTLPLLWLAPSRDPVSKLFAAQVAPLLPAGPGFSRQDMDSDHLDAPAAAAEAVVLWLRALPD